MKITPIRSSEAYEAALQRASVLITKSDRKSLDELDVLQALIERWERDRYRISAPTPLEAIRFRMEQGGLKPRDLEPCIGSRSRVSEVLSGRRPLSIDMIRALSAHLSIPAASLLGPVSAVHEHAPGLAQAAVAKLRSFGVMRPREDLSSFLARAFSGNNTPAMLRKTRTARTNAKTDPAALEAWCAAVLVKAASRKVSRFKGSISPEFGRRLAKLSASSDGLARVRDELAHVGIIFVTLEHLPGTYLDGAAMCRRDGAPIVALTLRHDRIDNFWFTLLHEYAHVCCHLKGETTMILDDLEVKSVGGIEEEADKFAQGALIPEALWKRSVSPSLTPADVIQIAATADIHPAIVAGRWQREYGDYRRFSKMLGRGEVRMQFLATPP